MWPAVHRSDLSQLYLPSLHGPDPDLKADLTQRAERFCLETRTQQRHIAEKVTIHWEELLSNSD